MSDDDVGGMDDDFGQENYEEDYLMVYLIKNICLRSKDFIPA